jgi:hypothetical protein
MQVTLTCIPDGHQHRVIILEVVLIQLSSWGWAHSCSKHVEDTNKNRRNSASIWLPTRNWITLFRSERKELHCFFVHGDRFYKFRRFFPCHIWSNFCNIFLLDPDNVELHEATRNTILSIIWHVYVFPLGYIPYDLAHRTEFVRAHRTEFVTSHNKQKESFQQYFYNRYKIVVYTGLRSDSIKNHSSHNEARRVAAMRIIFTRIGCTLLTCDIIRVN